MIQFGVSHARILRHGFVIFSSPLLIVLLLKRSRSYMSVRNSIDAPGLMDRKFLSSLISSIYGRISLGAPFSSVNEKRHSSDAMNLMMSSRDCTLAAMGSSGNVEVR